VLVVANNHYAYSTPSSASSLAARWLDRAAGYGIQGREVDGTQLSACLQVVARPSAERVPALARKWSSPSFSAFAPRRNDDAVMLIPASSSPASAGIA